MTNQNTIKSIKEQFKREGHKYSDYVQIDKETFEYLYGVEQRFYHQIKAMLPIKQSFRNMRLDFFPDPENWDESKRVYYAWNGLMAFVAKTMLKERN